MPENASITGKEAEELKAASGFRLATETEAKISVDSFKEYKAARAPRYADMVEADNFYHGVHFTTAQEKEIIAKGQAPLPINVTYSIIKQIVSLLTSEDPTWDVDPVEDADKEYSYLMRKLLSSTWYWSRGSRQFSQIAKSTVVTGVGYAALNPTRFGRQFGVQFKHLPYQYVYPSPNIREFDFSDAENIIVSKFVSYTQAAEIFGVSEDQIEEYAQSASDEWATDNADDDKGIPQIRYMSPLEGHRRIRMIQRTTMERTDVYFVKPKVNAGAGVGRKTYFTITPQVQALERTGKVTIEKQNMRVVAKYMSIGKHCRKYYIPLSGYNIMPFVDEFNDNPYPLGEIDFLMPLQKALNKFIMLSILNATLANNMKMMAVKGTIDKGFYEENYATPGVLFEYDWKEGQPTPQQLNPQPFTSQFFDFPKLMIEIMEYITGIFGVVQGNPQGAPRTASGLISLQNYGGQKVRLLGRNMNDALSTCGDIAIELYQNYAPYNGTASYLESGALEQATFNTLKSDSGGISIENDLSVGKFRTRAVIRQNYGSERELKANMLANLAAQTKTTMLLKPILKLADIPEADEILKDMDELANANQNIEQLQGQLQKLSQANEQLQNRVIKKSEQVDITEFRAELEILMAKITNELGVGIQDTLAEFKKLLDQEQEQRV